MTGTPNFTSDEAVHLANKLYGVQVTAKPLPSERDQNFALTTSSQDRYVLKIANSTEDREVLDFQNAALQHIALRDPVLSVSRVLRSIDKTDIGRIEDQAGRSHYVRLLTWVNGTMYVDVHPHDDPLLNSLGRALAKLDRAFADFHHPAMSRTLQWDLRHISMALQHLPLLSGEQQAIVHGFRPLWESIDWGALPTAVIHGDANDYNVVVRGGEVVGFLDFGDMSHSARVCDLAIAMVYAMLDHPDPVTAATRIGAAYHREFPLQRAEVEAIFPFIVSRLSMSACFAAYNAKAKPHDAYQLVTAAPAWRLLRRLAAVPSATVSSALRGALPLSR